MNNISNHIVVTHSKLENVPSGKIYVVVRKKGQACIYDTLGYRTPLNEADIHWKPLDKVVMMVKVVSTNVETLNAGQIYRVFDDTKYDERYIVDETGEMILFDRNMFKWEAI